MKKIFMRLITSIIILTIVSISCCIKTGISGYEIARPEGYGFDIIGARWGFDDKCQNGNTSVVYVDVSCEKDLQCEVYVNTVKSNYGVNGFQPCEDQLVAAEVELNQKPSFVTVQSGEKYYYTRRDKSRNIEVCCSHGNPMTQVFDRDNEMCQIITLDAQCRERDVIGFEQIKVLSWNLSHDGTLSMNVSNNVGQDALIRKIYFNNNITSTLTNYLQAGDSTNITVAGPHGNIGDGYGIGIEIEYSPATNSYAYFNSTGTISGTFS
jgi:hypothetical protein